jgi:hypothetical protein
MAMPRNKQSKSLPCRQLGRVDDEPWDALRDAARADGMSFTAWALSFLLPLADGNPAFRRRIRSEINKESKGR